MLKTVAFAIFLFVAPSTVLGKSARIHGAHVHGESELAVAVEAKKLHVEWRVPAGDLLGFEYQPESPEEKARWNRTMDTLKAFKDLIKLPAEAACRSVDFSLSGIDGGTPSHKAAGSHLAMVGHGRDIVRKDQERGKRASASHRDLVVSWTFECAKSRELRSFTACFKKNFQGVQRVRVRTVSYGTQNISLIQTACGQVRL